MSDRRAMEAAQLVAGYVAERVGVDADGPRYGELVARVQRAMTEAGASSANAFRRSLERDTEMFDHLVVALTVGESYFFREPAQIELLRRRALPERAEARGPGGTIQVWSAGCAAGQEAYTLVMLLGEEGLAARSHVLATDLSRQALDLAQRGVYGKWSLRALDDRRRRAYFREVWGGFQVEPALARSITFRQHNLLDAADRRIGGMDVVLCRNVLVYLTPAALDSVSRVLVEALAPGGWLLIASTDPRLEGVEDLRTVVTPEGIAYRRLGGGDGGGGRPSRREAAPRPRSAARAVPIPRPPRPRGTAAATTGGGTQATPGTPAGSADEALAIANEALAQGDYDRAATAAAELVGAGRGAEANVILVRALGSAGRLGAAATAAAAGATRFPMHVELRLLQSIVLLESGRPQEAAAAARAAAYLDPTMAMAHLTLARAEEAVGDSVAARRSYRNALTLLEAMPAEQPVALADGETAGRLAALARAAGGADRHSPARRTGA